MAKKFWIILVGALLVLALAPLTAYAQTLLATANQTVNLRSGPSRNYAVVGILSEGQDILLDGRDSGGFWVRGSVGGRTGWVATSFLNVTVDQVSDLPVLQETETGLVPQATAVPGATTSAPTVNVAPPTSSGFAYGGHVQSFSQATSNAMARAGMTWVKRQVRFSPGANPGDVAGIISDAQARGFNILLGIVGDANAVTQPGYFDQYASYVGGVAALGANAIEVWNEMNIDREWASGAIDPALYTQLLQVSYNAIKGANPNTLVISGAPAPTGFFGGCSATGCDDLPYIQGMAAAGAANYMDCVGVHYNEGIVDPSQTSGDPRDDFYTRYYGTMVSTYSGAFGGALPLCFTELGYLTPEGFGPLPGSFAWAQNVTLAQQAAWLDEVVSLAGNSGRVRLLIIWNVDFTGYGADPQAGYAIIRPDGSCPACDLLGS